MPDFKQAGRLMQFDSVLGTDKLLIDTFEGVEGISRLFDFQAELYADAGEEIDPSQILGTKASVKIGLLDVQGARYFNGIVASFEQTAGDTTFDVYRAHIVPSLWMLTLTTNCRTFQGKTVMEVIKEVISPYALSVGDETTFAYKPLDYCTQFNETDFNFISRLAEQFGIFYWFEHTEADNKIVFGDGRDAYSECPDVSEVPYSPQADNKEAMFRSVVSDVRVSASMVTGKHTSAVWDYRPYTVDRLGPLPSTHEYGKNAMERYHFPVGDGGYVKTKDSPISTPAHGARFLDAQRDASDVRANLFYGTSTARSFVPGFTFDLSDHPRDAWNQSYLLMELSHRAVQQPPYIGDAGHVQSPYSNRFVAIESERVYRPEAHTPRPRMTGPQLAIVVTPQGEDQYIDSTGRINVRFLWDRTAALHNTDNTLVRVSQSWASRGFGTYFWPRVDDEVLVEFIDGDPDDPVIVGSLYNGSNAKPKYALPDMSTRSGIVTRSSKGGGAANANELRFEDKMGSEQIFINAEKDMDHRIENDHRTYVGGQDSLIVKSDQLEDIGANFQRNIKGNLMENWAANADLNIGTDLTEKIGQNHSLQIGKNEAVKIGQNYAMDSGMNIYFKAGVGIVIESVEVTLKGAGGFINIGPAGVAISGTMVMINSGGAAGAGTAGETKDPTAPKPPDEADDGTKGGPM